MADVPCLAHSLDGSEGSLTMPRRRSMRDERTRGRNACKPFLAHMRAHLAPRAPVFES